MTERKRPSLRRLALTTTSAHDGLRLDALLGVWLPSALGRPLSKSAVRRLVMAGTVRVAGRPVRRPAVTLRRGSRVEVAVDVDRLSPAVREAPREELRVVYEDAHLLVVDKPPGLPTHATADPDRPHLVTIVTAFLAARGTRTPYVAVHQRLDRDTSGLVLFATDPAANAGLARAFAERQVEKTYHALTELPHRPPPAEWRALDRLAPAGKRRMIPVAWGGQEAATDFRLLESHTRGLLVAARPLTGRKHQIRAHLAGAGMPILGDEVYGARPGSASRVMLHARRLVLPHPLSGARLVLEAPYPGDFAEALSRLRDSG